jgi:arylsulfatase
MPTLAELAGGPKGDGLKKQIEAGEYPGFVKTTLDGVNQIDYLTGKSQKSARDVFYYYSGATLSALRYKNWKFYWTMPDPSAEGWLLPKTSYNFTLVQNLMRDPFEAAVGPNQDSAMSIGGALAAPQTAFIYDWNLLPLGQQLALQFLETFAKYPPLQAPSSYNLADVMQQIEAQKHAIKGSAHPSD